MTMPRTIKAETTSAITSQISTEKLYGVSKLTSADIKLEVTSERTTEEVSQKTSVATTPK